MTKDEALDLALEALEYKAHGPVSGEKDLTDRAITAIKQALAAPVQEPVASVHIKDGCLVGSHRKEGVPFPDGQYGLWPITTPPAAQRQWVGLTDDEFDYIFARANPHCNEFAFARAIEAKVFEKNGATGVTVPDALNPKDENPAYAAGWNDCRAEMLKGMKP